MAAKKIKRKTRSGKAAKTITRRAGITASRIAKRSERAFKKGIKTLTTTTRKSVRALKKKGKNINVKWPKAKRKKAKKK